MNRIIVVCIGTLALLLAGCESVTTGGGWVSDGFEYIGDLHLESVTDQSSLLADSYHLYVLTPGVGLRVIDIAFPGDMVTVGGYSVDASAMARDGDYLYLVGEGIEIVDIRYPETPEYLSQYYSWQPRDILPISWYGYIATEFGLETVDLGSPLAIQQIAFNDAIRDLKKLVRWGQYVYALHEDGVAIYETNNGMGPLLRSDIALDGVIDFEAEQGYLHVLTQYELIVFEAFNPHLPYEIGSLPLYGEILSLTRYGTLLYVAGGDNGITVASVADPHHPEILETYSPGGWYQQVITSGSYVFCSVPWYGIECLRYVESQQRARPVELRRDISAKLEP